MSVEKARKEEPARKRDSCFKDRRDVNAVEGASCKIGVVALLLESAIVMRDDREAKAIPSRPSQWWRILEISILELL